MDVDSGSCFKQSLNRAGIEKAKGKGFKVWADSSKCTSVN